MPTGKSDKPVAIPVLTAQTAPDPAEIPMSFVSPESSNIAGASFNPETSTLVVQFRGHIGQPDRLYAARDFTLAQWQMFLDAPSKGKFFAEQIKPLFTLVRLP